MSNTKPFVAAAFICEKILREEGDVLSAIRIVDTYTRKRVAIGLQQPVASNEHPPPPPPQVIDATHILDMMALVIVKAGSVSGEHEMALIIRNPEGKETRYPETFKVNFSRKDPAEGAQLTARFIMPLDTAPGLYWIDVLWDGEPLTSIPLRFARESESQADAEG